MSIRDRVRQRAIAFVQRHAPPDPLFENMLRDPEDLLRFPSNHSYDRPSLLAFLPEPAVRAGWVTVGKYSSVNSSTRIIVGGGHHPEWVSTFPFRIRYSLPGMLEDGQPSSRGPIHIGSDVWVGYGVIIQSGVSIGDGAVVATGSVVVKDVAPYSVVGGNPARHLRYRFDSEIVAALLRIKWWDWPDHEVLSRVAQLNDADVVAFVEEHDPNR